MRLTSHALCITTVGFALAACNDFGAEPVILQPQSNQISVTSTDGWYKATIRGYAHSRWLDFISLTVDNSTVPRNVRFVVDSLNSVALFHPDSLRVVNHSDNDTMYVAVAPFATYQLTGDTAFFAYYTKFVFPDGYTDKWKPTDPLDLSAYLHY